MFYFSLILIVRTAAFVVEFCRRSSRICR